MKIPEAAAKEAVARKEIKNKISIAKKQFKQVQQLFLGFSPGEVSGEVGWFGFD